jgi:hypothetical protein
LIIRPSAIFSLDNPPAVNIYRLVNTIYKRRFVMVEEGHNQKTTSYLRDLIEANIFLFDRLGPGVHTYQYVDYPVWSTRTLVDHIYGILKTVKNGLI